MLYDAFPSLAANLTPVSIAHGLHPVELSLSSQVVVLASADLIEKTISAIIEPLNEDESASLCVSFDAEWNIARTIGVSIVQLAPINSDNIYIIPVSHWFFRFSAEHHIRSMLWQLFPHLCSVFSPQIGYSKLA
jgi:hypothetical protein